jgi:Ni/Co efflux regulator RcnB
MTPTTLEVIMKASRNKILVSLAAAAVLAVPAAASAQHGADDPPGHVRHSSHVTRAHHSVRHHSRAADDDRGRDGARGSDDGPNHT